MVSLPDSAKGAGAEPRPVVEDLDYVLSLARAVPDGTPSDRVLDIGHWLAQMGLQAAQFDDLMSGFMERVADAGINISRFHLSGSTLHPEFVAISHTWWRDRANIETEHYTGDSAGAGNFLANPLVVLLASDDAVLRFDPQDQSVQQRFPMMGDYGPAGTTDYFIERVGFGFGRPPAPSDMVGVVLSWMTDDPDGFSDQDIVDMRALTPWFAVAARTRGDLEIMRTLLSVYLGGDAGQRVATGQIRRGDVVAIRAAILYADLRAFTNVSTQLQSDQLVELVNDYFGQIVGCINGQGGQVLKFIGDGLLAIFPLDEGEESHIVGKALDAAQGAIAAVDQINADRRAGPTCPGLDIALHVGELLYGNVGAPSRLDFTVVGPAVNAISRLEPLCQSLSAPIVMSEDFARHGGETLRVKSLGQHALRGLATPMEIFTPV